MGSLAGSIRAWDGRTRTSTDEHGQARTNTDKHGRTRTSTDEPERPGEGVWYFARPCSLCTSIESRRAHPGEATASPPMLLGTPSPSSALPVHAKLGFGGSERGAELGLGVPGGQPALFPRAFSRRFFPALFPRAFSPRFLPALFPLRFFPLTTIRHGSNHRGSASATDSVSRKGPSPKPHSTTRNGARTGNTASSRSTKRAKACPATPSRRWCRK